MTTTIKPRVGMTDRSRFVFKHARDEADLENCSDIGSEHILRGLIMEGSGIAASVLSGFGISANILNRNYVTTFEVSKSMSDDYDEWLQIGQIETSRLHGESADVFESARRQAVMCYECMAPRASPGWATGPYIGTEHLLLGILDVQNTGARKVIENQLHNATIVDIRNFILNLLGIADADSATGETRP